MQHQLMTLYSLLATSMPKLEAVIKVETNYMYRETWMRRDEKIMEEEILADICRLNNLVLGGTLFPHIKESTKQLGSRPVERTTIRLTISSSTVDRDTHLKMPW